MSDRKCPKCGRFLAETVTEAWVDAANSTPKGFAYMDGRTFDRCAAGHVTQVLNTPKSPEPFKPGMEIRNLYDNRRWTLERREGTRWLLKEKVWEGERQELWLEERALRIERRWERGRQA